MVMTKRVNFSSGSVWMKPREVYRNIYRLTGKFLSFARLSSFNHDKWILSLPCNFFPFVLFLFPLQLSGSLLLLKPQSLYDQLLSLLQPLSGLSELPNSLQLPLFLQTMSFLFCFDPSVQTDFYWAQTLTIFSWAHSEVASINRLLSHRSHSNHKPLGGSDTKENTAVTLLSFSGVSCVVRSPSHVLFQCSCIGGGASGTETSAAERDAHTL